MNLNIKLLIRANAALFTGALLGQTMLIIGLTRGVWINSQLYQEIAAENELIADILPPPLYLVELSRLVARAMVEVASAKDGSNLQSGPSVQVLKQQMPEFLRQYNERRQHWLTDTSIDSQSKQSIQTGAHEPATRWIELLESSLLPAINAGSRTQALEVYKQLGPAFALHRQENLQLVDHINRTIKADQEKVESSINTAVLLLAIATAMLLALAYTLLYLMQRYSVRPLDLIANDLGTGAEQFLAASDQVASSSQKLSAAAEQVASSSHNLAEGASEQAAAIEETSASLEEISSMIHSTARNAELAKSLAGEAQASAQMGLSSMTQMTNAMEAIEHSSNQVVKIVKSIDEIAFQTNILALNAAVEAARAGEAGAGFAVVAEEVRSLAQRSAAAANESAEKIEASITNSKQGSECLKSVGESFNLIGSKIKETDNLVAEIALAAKEQAQGIEHITQAVQEMSKVAQSSALSIEEMSKVANASASNSEQIATAAEEMRSQAGRQRQITSQLRNVVDGSTNVDATTGQVQPYLLAEAQQSEVKLPVSQRRNRQEDVDAHFRDF